MASITSIGMSNLPNECLIEIFSKFESPRTLCNIQSVCKSLLAIGRSSLAWKHLYTRYFPEHQQYINDPQKVRALFFKGSVITDDENRVDYCELFKQSLLKSRVKKSLFFYALSSIPKEYSEGDYFQGSNEIVLRKTRTKLKKIFGKLRSKSLLQQELYLRSKAERVWTMTLKSCVHQDNSQHRLQRIYNYPNLLLMMFDFFASEYDFIPEDNLDYWIEHNGFALLEDNPNTYAFLLKAYFLYCVLKSKDLTPFVEAVKRNFKLVEPNEMPNSLMVNNEIFKAYEFASASLRTDFEEFEQDFVVHDVILGQFLGLKGFIRGLFFSHLCQCKGISPNLFLSQEHRCL